MSEDRYDELELPEEREQPEREARQEPRDAPEGTAEEGARGVAEGELGGRDLGARDDEGFADENAGELAIKYKSADSDHHYSAGKVDLSYHFDTNRAANDGYGQFLALSLVNNLSIPFPDYGGFGGWMRVDFGDVYAMLGIADSATFAAVAPWETLAEDSWYQLGELGFKVDSGSLGKGTIRLNPWHNHLLGEDGWGLGVNVDQELGSAKVVGFLRAGHGDGDVTPVESFLSGGVSLIGLFDRPHDTLGVGASWSDPSTGNGARAETLLEAYYSFQLSPSVRFSPDLQLVFDPAQSTSNDRVLVVGLRLVVQL